MLICICHVESYLVNLSKRYDGDVDEMCNLSFVYFHVCCNSKNDAAFILLQ